MSAPPRWPHRGARGRSVRCMEGMKSMELSLAVAEACGPTTCDIRLVTGGLLTARYGERVQDRIKVRPGDLVAVDGSVEPPAVVWRWWHGTIERLAGDRAAVS